jgi:hypothetical protein
MPLVCRVCSRLNPDPARYCFHDGAALHGAQEGPIAVGERPFLTPFVFPSGKSCRTFNELLLACEADWPAGRDMLRQGFFESFFGGLGRADLALAARQAGGEPDGDDGLDRLLAALPGERRPPVLVVEPREVHLGQVRRGEDRRFKLRLQNEGMGLLAGAVQSEAPWLAVGEGAGVASKVFRCRNELALDVHVHGKALRAHPRPQEGRLVVTGNGGVFAVVVRVEVPLTPYPAGVLAGALTPRQLAEKARAAPRDAAPLFESGAVARWYEANGWTYPVQGPAASGMAAVQQFFEALGLTHPPRVQLSQTHVQLSGPAGGSAEAFLFVESSENRPVYAHAVSETPWLHAGRAKGHGNTVKIHLRVPTVPALPGEKLQGKALVTANGNQRFTVEVTLAVHPGSPSRGYRDPPPVRRSKESEEILAVPPDTVRVVAAPVLEVPPTPASKARRVHLGPEDPPAPAGGPDDYRRAPFVADEPAAPHLVPAPPSPNWDPPGFEDPRGREEQARAPQPAAPHLAPLPIVGDDAAGRRRRRTWPHLLPLAALAALLLLAVVHDLLLPGGEGEGPDVVAVDPTKVLDLRFNDQPLGAEYPGATMTFGLAAVNGGKRLMFDALGRTNNTCVRIDGADYLFGNPDLAAFPAGTPVHNHAGVARWVQTRAPLGTDASGRARDGARSVWEVLGLPGQPCGVRVTQTVEVVPNAQTGKLDTCLVRYTLHNADAAAHDVGLRFLLDTYIGDNDGVPFTIPGKAGLCSTRQSFERPEEVPDYIQALENESLLAPGTVAHVQFRVPGELESPTRVLLGGYPDGPLKQLGYPLANGWFTPWEVPPVTIRELFDRRAELRPADPGERPLRDPVPDSAVTLYWDVRRLEPGARRAVGFAYGLGVVASSEGEGKLLLTLGGRTVKGGEFTLTALRASPLPGERLTLVVPPGDRFDLLGPAEQAVPAVAGGSARPISTVTWRLRARRVGRSALVVRSTAGVSQKQAVRITPPPQGVLD